MLQSIKDEMHASITYQSVPLGSTATEQPTLLRHGYNSTKKRGSFSAKVSATQPVSVTRLPKLKLQLFPLATDYHVAKPHTAQHCRLNSLGRLHYIPLYRQNLDAMAALRCLRWLRPVANPPRAIPTFSTASLRLYSAEATLKTPKSLPLIKNDLKTAMRAKDAPRLAVLRTILSANLNASKTSSPIQTDIQLVALLRKLRKQYEDAATEAEGAGRSELVEKERQQLDILDGYIQACGVETVAASDLEAIVQKAADAAKAAQAGPKEIMGKVMGAVMGQLEGKDVDKKTLAELVKKATSGSK